MAHGACSSLLLSTYMQARFIFGACHYALCASVRLPHGKRLCKYASAGPERYVYDPQPHSDPHGYVLAWAAKSHSTHNGSATLACMHGEGCAGRLPSAPLPFTIMVVLFTVAPLPVTIIVPGPVTLTLPLPVTPLIVAPHACAALQARHQRGGGGYGTARAILKRLARQAARCCVCPLVNRRGQDFATPGVGLLELIEVAHLRCSPHDHVFTTTGMSLCTEYEHRTLGDVLLLSLKRS